MASAHASICVFHGRAPEMRSDPRQGSPPPRIYRLPRSVPVYHTRPQTWNLDLAKAPELNDRKRVHISNIDPFTIVEFRELWRSPNSKFQADRSIQACTSFASVLMVGFLLLRV